MNKSKNEWKQTKVIEIKQNQTKKLEQPYSIKNKWKQPNQEQTTAHTNKTKEEQKQAKTSKSNQEGNSERNKLKQKYTRERNKQKQAKKWNKQTNSVVRYTELCGEIEERRARRSSKPWCLF